MACRHDESRFCDLNENCLLSKLDFDSWPHDTMSNAFASGSSSPVTYRPYEPRGKRPSTSSLPASPPTLKPTNSSPGLVRPAPSIEAPQPFRPLLRNDWASSTQSLPPLERENRPSSTSNLTNGRPTPPLAHSAVPVGISPSLPSSPRRVASPVASPSVERGNQPKSRRAAQPYRSKFQPPGMTNDRTDDFLARRKALGEGKKLEEGRLGRRLEKVCSFHCWSAGRMLMGGADYFITLPAAGDRHGSDHDD